MQVQENTEKQKITERHLEGGEDTRLCWTRRLKLMRDAGMVHPPAQGQVVSRTRLALKLYKGAQSVSSYTERVSKQPWPHLAQPTCGRGAAVWLRGTLTQSPTCNSVHNHAVWRDPINSGGGGCKCILLSTSTKTHRDAGKATLLTSQQFSFIKRYAWWKWVRTKSVSLLALQRDTPWGHYRFSLILI